MREKHYAILTVILLGGSFLMLSFNSYFDSKPKTHGIKVKYQLDSKVLSDSFRKIIVKPIRSSDPTFISGLFFIEPDACPPCLNNTFDYIELFKETGVEPKAVFIDRTRKEVDRFIGLIGFNIDYFLIERNELPLEFMDATNELIFIETKKNIVFHRISLLGNITTPLEYKKRAISEAMASLKQN